MVPLKVGFAQDAMRFRMMAVVTMMVVMGTVKAAAVILVAMLIATNDAGRIAMSFRGGGSDGAETEGDSEEES